MRVDKEERLPGVSLFLYEQTLIKQSKSAEAEIVMMKNDDY